jgi:hypothetical protein
MWLGKQVTYMKELCPGVGEKTTRQRIKELEKKAATLPVIFALLFTEAIKSTIGMIPVPHITIPTPVKFLIAALIVAVIYIYEEDAGMYAERAKDVAYDND